jgi:predicted heme/steroid binding protein
MSLPKFFIWFVLTISLLSSLFMVWSSARPAVLSSSSDAVFTPEHLSRFDGTDPNQPTYLALNGLVYDISAGRDEFYAPGKPYHYLAGKDSTQELMIAGDVIIRRKYPVVGKLIY